MRSDPTTRSVDRPVRPPLAAVIAVHVVAVGGIVATGVIGRPRYFGMAVIIAASVLVLDALLWLPGDQPTRLGRVSRRVSLRVLSLIPSDATPVVTDRRSLVALLAVSLSVLGTVGRGLAFFVAMTAFFCGCFLRVATASYDDRGATHATLFTETSERDRTHERGWAGDLSLFVAGSSSLAVAQTLTVAYYARTFDAIFHTTLASRIAEFGTLAVVRPGRYEALLLSHVHASLGLRLTGLPPRTYGAVAFGLLVPAALVGVFAVFRTVLDSTRTALLGAGLLAVNPSLFRWAVHVHAQTFNFVFMMTVLVLLTKWRADARVTALTVLMATAMATTHHLSAAMSLTLLAVPIGLLVLWFASVGSELRLRPTLVRYALLVAVTAVYWFQNGIVSQAVGWTTERNVRSGTGLPTIQFVIRRYDDPVALSEATVPFLLNNLHYAGLLIPAGVAVASLSNRNRPLRLRVAFVAAVFVAAVLLYLPNPVWIPLRGIAALNRWELMVLPFFLLPAVGMAGLLRRADDPVRRLVTGLLVVGVVFTSISGGFTDPSLADTAGFEKGAQRYFSETDLAAVTFVTTERNVEAGQPVYGPTLFPDFMQCQTWREPEPDSPRGFAQLTANDGAITVQPGLSVVPESTLRTGLIRVLRIDPPAYDRDVAVRDPVSADEVAWSRTGRNVVYDNGETVVAYAPATPGEGSRGVRCK